VPNKALITVLCCLSLSRLVGVIIFGLAFIKKKSNQTEFFLLKKPNRNRFKPTGFGSVWFGLVWFFRIKTGSNQFGSAFSGLALFFSGLDSVRFGFRLIN
jgi:hypothetical protein